MKTTSFLITILFVAFVVASFVSVGGIIKYGMEINELEDDIEDWKDLYNNNPLIKIVTQYNNNTEYIPEYIYNNETIYEYIYDNNTIYLDRIQFDVTGDGLVDYQDVCSVYSYVMNGLSYVEQMFYNNYPNGFDVLYDVDRSGCVNLEDVELILLHSDI